MYLRALFPESPEEANEIRKDPGETNPDCFSDNGKKIN